MCVCVLYFHPSYIICFIYNFSLLCLVILSTLSIVFIYQFSLLSVSSFLHHILYLTIIFLCYVILSTLSIISNHNFSLLSSCQHHLLYSSYYFTSFLSLFKYFLSHHKKNHSLRFPPYPPPPPHPQRALTSWRRWCWHSSVRWKTRMSQCQSGPRTPSALSSAAKWASWCR